MPQLALQQTWPTLQVFMPQATLTGFCIEVQVCCEQVAPGAAQMPQLALQQT
jgi:hypothetical protein